MKYAITILKSMLILYMGLAITGCAIFGSSEPPVRRIEPRFDYEPVEAAREKRDITIAAVGSQFEIPIGQNPSPLFERFASNMADDFGEIITARGYTLRGPFQTFDEMTFVDKDNSNLILTAKVTFIDDLTGTDVRYNKGAWGIGAGGWKVSGEILVSGRISLIISESLTNEKMWTKSVNIRSIAVELTPTLYERRTITVADVLKNDDRFYTELGKLLDKQYYEIMNRTYGYLDPREMMLINKQAAELRKRKVF